MTMKRFALLLTILVLFTSACNGTTSTLSPTQTTSSSVPVQYPMEVREAVHDEALSILQARGFWPEIVAGLGYGGDSIDLLFYGKADPEVVEIVRGVIDDKAPGLPLEITENVTIETQTPTTITSTSEQPQNGMQFVEDIIDLLREDGGWVPPLPPEGGQKPRILTEEEKDRVLAIASSFPQVTEAMMNKDVAYGETWYIWIGWNGSQNGHSHLMHGAVENGTANLSNRSDRWYPGIKFIFNSIYGDLGRAGIHVAVNLETEEVVHSGAFSASDIMGSKIPPEFPTSSTVPQLISPEPSEVMQNGGPKWASTAVWNFDWSDVEGATQYHLYVKFPSARNPLVDSANITESSHILAFMGTISSHYGWIWKVRAMVDGVWSEWSETRTFNVEFVNTE